MTHGTHACPTPHVRDEARRVRASSGKPRRLPVPPVTAAWALPGRYCSSSSLSSPGPPGVATKGGREWDSRVGLESGAARTIQRPRKRERIQSKPEREGGTSSGKASRFYPIQSSSIQSPSRREGGTRRGLGRVCPRLPWEGRTEVEEEEEGSPAVGRACSYAQVPGLRQGPRGRHRARQCAGVGVPPGLRRVGHPDADGVQRRRAFPRAVDRLQARRRARPPQDHALQGVRGRLVGASRLGEGGQHQGVLRRHIPVAAAAAERDHRAGREETEEALPEEIQKQGRGALGGGHGEGARVRHLPRGQPQDRAARLCPHALHTVLRGLER